MIKDNIRKEFKFNNSLIEKIDMLKIHEQNKNKSYKVTEKEIIINAINIYYNQVFLSDTENNFVEKMNLLISNNIKNIIDDNSYKQNKITNEIYDQNEFLKEMVLTLIVSTQIFKSNDIKTDLYYMNRNLEDILKEKYSETKYFEEIKDEK